MSNEIQSYANQLPAEMRAQMEADVAKDLDRLSSAGKDTIRVTQDKKFLLPDDIEVPELKLIILDFVYRNEYYPGAFKQKEIASPSCFAVNERQADLAPTLNSPYRQADKCNECQWDKYGSSSTGEGKACKNTVFMAVLPTDATDDTTLHVLRTSPTGITPFSQYVAKIARSMKLAVYGVVTRVTFSDSVTYASLRFNVEDVNPIPEETLKRREEARRRLLQEPDFSNAIKP